MLKIKFLVVVYDYDEKAAEFSHEIDLPDIIAAADEMEQSDFTPGEGWLGQILNDFDKRLAALEQAQPQRGEAKCKCGSAFVAEYMGAGVWAVKCSSEYCSATPWVGSAVHHLQAKAKARAAQDVKP